MLAAFIVYMLIGVVVIVAKTRAAGIEVNWSAGQVLALFFCAGLWPMALFADFRRF